MQGEKEGRSQALSEAVEVIEEMKGIIWNDDIEKHKVNVTRHNTIDEVLQALKPLSDKRK
jgi:prolyl-tRNA synthetase